MIEIEMETRDIKDRNDINLLTGTKIFVNTTQWM